MSPCWPAALKRSKQAFASPAHRRVTPTASKPCALACSISACLISCSEVEVGVAREAGLPVPFRPAADGTTARFHARVQSLLPRPRSTVHRPDNRQNDRSLRPRDRRSSAPARQPRALAREPADIGQMIADVVRAARIAAVSGAPPPCRCACFACRCVGHQEIRHLAEEFVMNQLVSRRTSTRVTDRPAAAACRRSRRHASREISAMMPAPHAGWPSSTSTRRAFRIEREEFLAPLPHALLDHARRDANSPSARRTAARMRTDG